MLVNKRLSKLSIKNCNQTAADKNMVTIDSLETVANALSDNTSYDFPFIHNTAQLAYHSAIRPFNVIQDQWFTCHLKANMRLPISDQ